MKFLNVILMLALALSVVACGGDAPSQEQTDAVETPAAEEVTPEAAAPAEAAHGEGAAFTSAYVCHMHCEGSGSDQPGKCPVCGMDYVANADHAQDGHKH